MKDVQAKPISRPSGWRQLLRFIKIRFCPGTTDRPGIDEKPPERPHESPVPEEERVGKATLVLKWFFLAMSIGLVATTMLGIYMAFKYNRSPALVWGMLIGGAAIPIVLIVVSAI